jgi:hypothetical protein
MLKRKVASLEGAQPIATTSTGQAQRAARTDLDGMVINLELTLISIIQGVALYFLTESARGQLAEPKPQIVPYVIAGLFIILLWWSRAVIHTLTVIRWPIEFLHNFMYVATTLVEAAMFAQLANPANWFTIGAGFALLLWALFVSDLRLIMRRLSEPNGPAAQALLHILEREQRIHVRMSMPLTVLFYLSAAVAIRAQPEFFIRSDGHLLFAIPQLAGAVAYVVYIVLFFRSVSGRILDMRSERATV